MAEGPFFASIRFGRRCNGSYRCRRDWLPFRVQTISTRKSGGSRSGCRGRGRARAYSGRSV